MNDGAGRNGWGVAAFLTTRDGQATPVGYELGFQSSTPTQQTYLWAGAMERVGDTLYHLGGRMGPSPGIAMAALDVSDPEDMAVLWSDAFVDPAANMPVYLRTDGNRLYQWTNTDAASTWNCTVWDLSHPENPQRGNRLSWTVPSVWDWRGHWHHAVSRGALYVLDPVSWRVRVYDCADVHAVQQAPGLALPTNPHPNARIAADDSVLAVGVRHFRDGAWVSSLICYDISSDPLAPVELWRLEEAPVLNAPARQPIGIIGAELIYTDGSNRVTAMDLETQAITAQSDLLGPERAVLDWDVRGDLLFRKLRDTRAFLPHALFEGLEMSALQRLPATMAFQLAGYGWWPEGWIGPPVDLGHEFVVWGPGIVAGIGGLSEGIDMWTDASGGVWTAWAGANKIYVARMSACAAGGDTWGTPIEVATQAGVLAVGISGVGDRMHVAAKLSTGDVVEWRSVDGGGSWQGPYTVAS